MRDANGGLKLCSHLFNPPSRGRVAVFLCTPVRDGTVNGKQREQVASTSGGGI